MKKSKSAEADGIPSPEKFDLSTEEGFLRDFDQLEQSMPAARNQIGKNITEDVLSAAATSGPSSQKSELSTGWISAWLRYRP